MIFLLEQRRFLSKRYVVVISILLLAVCVLVLHSLNCFGREESRVVCFCCISSHCFLFQKWVEGNISVHMHHPSLLYLLCERDIIILCDLQRRLDHNYSFVLVGGYELYTFLKTPTKRTSSPKEDKLVCHWCCARVWNYIIFQDDVWL